MSAQRCACTDVPIGSHAAVVEMPIPEHMQSYADARVAAGLSPTICIDRCIVQEITHLWRQDIITYGSCCGHNSAPAMVNVADSDVARMKAMGYRVLANPCRPDDDTTFQLRWSARIWTRFASWLWRTFMTSWRYDRMYRRRDGRSAQP